MSVEPLSESAENTRIKLWQGKFGNAQPYDIVGKIKEELTTGGNEDWVRWRCLNRLRVDVGMTKATVKQWGYVDEGHDTLCECGEHEQTVQHLIKCRLLKDAVKIYRHVLQEGSTIHKGGCTRYDGYEEEEYFGMDYFLKCTVPFFIHIFTPTLCIV